MSKDPKSLGEEIADRIAAVLREQIKKEERLNQINIELLTKEGKSAVEISQRLVFQILGEQILKLGEDVELVDCIESDQGIFWLRYRKKYGSFERVLDIKGIGEGTLGETLNYYLQIIVSQDAGDEIKDKQKAANVSDLETEPMNFHMVNYDVKFSFKEEPEKLQKEFEKALKYF